MITLSSIFTFNTIALSLVSAYNTGNPSIVSHICHKTLKKCYISEV